MTNQNYQNIKTRTINGETISSNELDELKKDADFGTREINRLTISGKIAEAINLRPLVLEYKDLIAKAIVK